MLIYMQGIVLLIVWLIVSDVQQEIPSTLYVC